MITTEQERGGEGMRKLIILSIIFVVFTVSPVWAWGEGRYQAIATDERTFVLDTEKGHFWFVFGRSHMMYGGQLSTKMKKGELYPIREKKDEK